MINKSWRQENLNFLLVNIITFIIRYRKRIIFNNTDDYDRFILLLYLCNSSNSVDIKNLFDEGMTFNDILNLDRGNSLVSIGSYVLMPNHFHILAKEVIEGGISKFMINFLQVIQCTLIESIKEAVLYLKVDLKLFTQIEMNI